MLTSSSSKNTPEILNRAFSKVIQNQEELLKSNSVIKDINQSVNNIQDILESQTQLKQILLNLNEFHQSIDQFFKEIMSNQIELQQSVISLQNELKQLHSMGNSSREIKNKFEKPNTPKVIKESSKKNHLSKNNRNEDKLKPYFALIQKLKTIIDLSNANNSLTNITLANIIKLINKIVNTSLFGDEIDSRNWFLGKDYHKLENLGKYKDYIWIEDFLFTSQENPYGIVNKKNLDSFKFFYDLFSKDFKILS